ncbi:hypothetical protein [Actinoplanes sp. L3-i22]|uniref:hypothetical protein n=1 Tax=Actinoplanes sp. L3-i22 TaxID=2836373 RepID=UPI0021036AA7|nr:hypothetical protein [Actinoplanes sp. L3-i22]
MDESFSDPFSKNDRWELDPPRPIAPTPATMTDTLRGRRVLIGLPGLGWRGDLRADEKVIQGSRTYIPVMPEAEWYRAEAEQTEVFAVLVPVDRVWVEELGVVSTQNRAGQLHPRGVSLDYPPRRPPTQSDQAGPITGRRSIRLLDDGGEQRDLRVTTELYASQNGDICARVCVELEWYRWSWTGNVPQTLEVPATLLWIE